MDKEFERIFNLGRRAAIADVRIKLIKRANHFLKSVGTPDSPMILVAAELKIQADEISSLNTSNKNVPCTNGNSEMYRVKSPHTGDKKQ